MDTLAALALATGPPSIELLNRPPYRKFEYIISRKMLKHIIGQAIFQNILLYAVIFGAQDFIQEDYLNYDSIGIPKKEIDEHPNKKIREWDTKYVLNGM
jgi:Ca2+ transporting ATPase